MRYASAARCGGRGASIIVLIVDFFHLHDHNYDLTTTTTCCLLYLLLLHHVLLVPSSSLSLPCFTSRAIARQLPHAIAYFRYAKPSPSPHPRQQSAQPWTL